MGFVKDFKAFALKGNVIDLAVAVIIGAAFGAIISSLVDDVITPLILNPLMTKAGVNDISGLTWGAVKYGKFLAAVIKFFMIALVLFLNRKSGCKSFKERRGSTCRTIIYRCIADGNP
jgi:large conductance mechanosensitive channel